MFAKDSYEDWRDIEVVDADGDRIGSVLEVLIDTDTDKPEWLVVDVEQTGDHRMRAPLMRLVPLAGISFGEDAVVSRWSRHVVAASPFDGVVDGISRADEDLLYRYYQLDYPTHWINDGLPGGAETIGVAGIAVESHHPTGSPSRSVDGPASEHEIDEPRRVRPVEVVDNESSSTA